MLGGVTSCLTAVDPGLGADVEDWCIFLQPEKEKKITDYSKVANDQRPHYILSLFISCIFSLHSLCFISNNYESTKLHFCYLYSQYISDEKSKFVKIFVTN